MEGINIDTNSKKPYKSGGKDKDKTKIELTNKGKNDIFVSGDQTDEKMDDIMGLYHSE